MNFKLQIVIVILLFSSTSVAAMTDCGQGLDNMFTCCPDPNTPPVSDGQLPYGWQNGNPPGNVISKLTKVIWMPGALGFNTLTCNYSYQDHFNKTKDFYIYAINPIPRPVGVNWSYYYGGLLCVGNRVNCNFNYSIPSF